FYLKEAAKGETTTLSVTSHNIKVTEAVQDEDTLTFVIVSQKLSGTGEYHVVRTYDDFEWLQQHLFSQEDVPGIQGIIFPPLPAKAQVNGSVKVIKQLGMYLCFLAMGQDLRPYCMALEAYLRQVASHSTLGKNKAVEIFLTCRDPPGHQKVRKNIFNRLSQAVEEMRKEGHKDVDVFFQTERDHNLPLTAFTKTAVEVSTKSECLFVCLPLCSSVPYVWRIICVSVHVQKNTMSVAENNVKTLGLGLDLESRYQEAEKEMLFRRTCKLVELETASRNAEKAKPVKKAAVSVHSHTYTTTHSQRKKKKKKKHVFL
uniref:Si:dkey-28n18.9 n=1 Tax=Myripristis murdjan TaxID=586833 RepID=A0A668ACH8_9TELE